MRKRIEMETNNAAGHREKIVVGISGGIDSYFSALLLKKSGVDVIGATLVFSEHTDIEAAQRAADAAGIQLAVRDCRELFSKEVKEAFAREYHRGRTPNPCVICNRQVKMRMLCELCRELSCDGYSSGHYAGKTRLENGRLAICAASDPIKDQSYMLCRLTQEEIEFFRPTMSSVYKEHLRHSEALLKGAPDFGKESQDICFVSDGGYASFVQAMCGESKRGFFIDEQGIRLARHNGIANYTVGQRKGLGVALGYPAYVVDIDPVSGDITLAGKERIFRDSVVVSDLCFQGLGENAAGEFEFDAKIRYAAPAAKCRVRIDGGVARACFEKPQRNPAPGQSAVFYRDGVIMFSGFIERQI